jgi:16S rRNA (uracil1498-N3)-methyltransferase
LLLFNERGGLSISEALGGVTKECPIVALIGPEGGWSNDELDLLNEVGCKSVTLGPRVLRTETAAVASVTLIQHAMGGFTIRGAA